MGSRSPITTQVRQYHGLDDGQYHARTVRETRLSAKESGLFGKALNAYISSRLISGLSITHLSLSEGEGRRESLSRSTHRTGLPNDRSTGRSMAIRYHYLVANQPQAREETATDARDTRRMVQIGVALGFVYVGFLAVWIWATRFRARSSRSART
jgi:hypothetical protein